MADKTIKLHDVMPVLTDILTDAEQIAMWAEVGNPGPPPPGPSEAAVRLTMDVMMHIYMIKGATRRSVWASLN